MKVATALMLGLFCRGLQAQQLPDLTIAGQPVQFRVFGSQGFMYSDQNNYMTMATSKGSFAFSDVGANVSMRITDNLRVGAQIYDRNIGALGNWQPTLDWAQCDYRFKDWLGFRGGKVKTTLGLYNDTQDMEFIHTWALMPQSVYSLDQRGSMISHVGGDVYGNIDLKKIGGLNYTVYGGQQPQDSTGGWVYAMTTSTRTGFSPNGLPVIVPASTKTIDSYNGTVYGADLRWNTPLKGVLVGSSYVNQDRNAHGTWTATNSVFRFMSTKDLTNAFYVQYTLGNFRFDGEYRRELFYAAQNSAAKDVYGTPTVKDIRSGYVAAAYRLSKLFEFGAYCSRFYNDWHILHSDPLNHVFDYAVTGRIDLRSYLDLKIEGHFMDGTSPGLTVSRGFYAVQNSTGTKPQTNLLVVRLGFHI